jgi:hypothetical protein
VSKANRTSIQHTRSCRPSRLCEMYIRVMRTYSGDGRCVENAKRPNQRMKLSWRSGRVKGNGSILMAAAAPRSLCAIR